MFNLYKAILKSDLELFRKAIKDGEIIEDDYRVNTFIEKEEVDKIFEEWLGFIEKPYRKMVKSNKKEDFLEFSTHNNGSTALEVAVKVLMFKAELMMIEDELNKEKFPSKAKKEYDEHITWIKNIYPSDPLAISLYNKSPIIKSTLSGCKKIIEELINNDNDSSSEKYSKIFSDLLSVRSYDLAAHILSKQSLKDKNFINHLSKTLKVDAAESCTGNFHIKMLLTFFDNTQASDDYNTKLSITKFAMMIGNLNIALNQDELNEGIKDTIQTLVTGEGEKFWKSQALCKDLKTQEDLLLPQDIIEVIGEYSAYNYLSEIVDS